MRDVMIDLETMGTRPGSAVVALGACFFDRATAQIGETFDRVISLKSNAEHGLTIDPDTVMWWMRQSEEARSILQAGEELSAVLCAFTAWLFEQGTGPVRPWGNAASFDCGLLACAYRAIGQSVPWKFWDERCYRTLKEENKDVPFVRSGTAHHALSDAISQARHACAIYAARAAVTGDAQVSGRGAFGT